MESCNREVAVSHRINPPSQQGRSCPRVILHHPQTQRRARSKPVSGQTGYICILNVSIHKVQGPLLSGRHDDDEGTGAFSLKIGVAGVYGAAGRYWVCRERDVQDNNDDMWDLSRQMIWRESNGQQFNIWATELFFNCDVTRITPSAIHLSPLPFHLPLLVQSRSARMLWKPSTIQGPYISRNNRGETGLKSSPLHKPRPSSHPPTLLSSSASPVCFSPEFRWYVSWSGHNAGWH